MNPKLSILIPTTPDRESFLLRLLENMEKSSDGPVDFYETEDRYIGHYNDDDNYLWTFEVLVELDNKEHSIGWKRNRLIERASGHYVAFIDDDDRISDTYFKNIFEGIERGKDCCSLTGIITEDGNNPLVFQHSIKYREYKTNPEGMPVRYERYPNHLNCIKSSIAKQFRFPEINHGEDTDFATQIFKAEVLKTEHWIEDVIYYYDYRSNK